MAEKDIASLQCVTPSGMDYDIPHVDTDWIRKKQQTAELFSGETLLEIPDNTIIDLNTQTLLLDGPPTLVNEIQVRNRHRHLSKTTGARTVLVVRIRASNTETSVSEAQLSSDVFGGNDDEVNLRSQYLACSHGKLEFRKAADRNGRSARIRNGVVTISVSSSTGVGDRNMVNAVNTELNRQFLTHSANLANHVMYCLPPGTTGRIAYAYINGYRSVYNDRYCSSVSIQMHEVGHNLNLGHSAMNNNELGDKTGMMGYSYGTDESPRMCFNAAKSWQLGWYSDKALRITPTTNAQNRYFGQLASIVDYPTTNKNVLIEINFSRASWAYFLNYNAMKGMNSQTLEGRNKLMITRKYTTNESNNSDLLSGLSEGDEFKDHNFNGVPGETLTVRFISVSNGVANISILLSSPSIPTPLPTEAPTVRPTLSAPPSDLPSNVPSDEPSDAPTAVLSDVPSDVPSVESSSTPVVIPSPVSSESPTPLETQPTSTVVPLVVPSPVSSEPPSLFLSAIPSFEPTSTGPREVSSDEPSDAPSDQPSLGPSGTSRPTGTSASPPSPAPSKSTEPSQSPSQKPTALPSSEPPTLPTAKPSLSAMPSPSPSTLPSDTPSSVPTMEPSQSVAPSPSPSSNPTLSITPSTAPSNEPSVSSRPTSQPTVPPSSQPSGVPSQRPSQSSVPSTQPSSSESPTNKPSILPSQSLFPSISPSTLPSSMPSDIPSKNPSSAPSDLPSSSPSDIPSDSPSDAPSKRPSSYPSSMPSGTPSMSPSTPFPSHQPSSEPSRSHQPSNNPSNAPSALPSRRPSPLPTLVPSPSPSSAPFTQPPTRVPSAFLQSNETPSEPTSTPSQDPSPTPSSSPTLAADRSHLRSSQPSTSPSVNYLTVSSSLELESTIQVSVSGPTHIQGKMNLVCSPLEDYVDQMMKEQYGYGEVTTVSCDGDDSGDQILFTAVLKSSFQDDLDSPSQSEYDSALNTMLSSNATLTALALAIREEAVSSGQPVDETLVQMDSTAEPPVLTISFEDSVESGGGGAPSSNGLSVPKWAGVLTSAILVALTT